MPGEIQNCYLRLQWFVTGEIQTFYLRLLWSVIGVKPDFASLPPGPLPSKQNCHTRNAVTHLI